MWLNYMNEEANGCCACGGGCCGGEQEKKKLVLDLLYLDLSVCGRCQGAEQNLEEAITEVSGVLKAAGFEIVVNKIEISSKELAEQYRFISSPTIRINGVDLDLEVKETPCRECGDLCGDDVDCRVWVYDGVEYSEPPKAMIVNGILQAVYRQRKKTAADEGGYELPDNLRRFFAGIKRKAD